MYVAQPAVAMSLNPSTAAVSTTMMAMTVVDLSVSVPLLDYFALLASSHSAHNSPSLGAVAAAVYSTSQPSVDFDLAIVVSMPLATEVYPGLDGHCWKTHSGWHSMVLTRCCGAVVDSSLSY